MDAVNEYIPDPVHLLDKAFLMPTEDAFLIPGSIKIGEEVEILGLSQRPPLKLIVTGVDMSKKVYDNGQAGDNVGLLFHGLKRAIAYGYRIIEILLQNC